MAIVAASVMGYVDEDTMSIVCITENDICAYSRGINTAFAFSIITVIICFVCAALVGLTLLVKKILKFAKHPIKGANSLAAVMELISLIIVPVLFKNAYSVSFFDYTDDNGKAFWACTFISMIFNMAACSCVVGLSL